jgi:hypothetical protein
MMTVIIHCHDEEEPMMIIALPINQSMMHDDACNNTD